VHLVGEPEEGIHQIGHRTPAGRPSSCSQRILGDQILQLGDFVPMAAELGWQPALAQYFDQIELTRGRIGRN